MKTVRQLLTEYHLVFSKDRLEALKNINAPIVLIESIERFIATCERGELRFNGDVRGWIKPYLDKEVISIPLLIKDGKKIIGIALQIGYIEGNNKTVSDYITYSINQYDNYEFKHTVSPDFKYSKDNKDKYNLVNSKLSYE